MSCRISETTIGGLKGVYLENDVLKIGILVDRGSDIFEFRYKPRDIDFLLRLSKGISNPQTHFSQLRSTKSQFEDYYYGGWQVCLPNSPAFNYRGAELGQHGEVALIPWEARLVENWPAKVILKCTATVLRLPIQIERVFSIEKDSAILTIEERVSNLGATSLDIMWGQHIAFGLPFLESGVSIDTNARTMETENAMPDWHRFKRGEIYQWPNAKSKSGRPDDARVVSPRGEDTYSDLCYLQGFDRNAYYAIQSKAMNLGFALRWDGSLFKELWLWQERNATQDFPWWGDCYTVALEPWTSKWTSDPLNAIEKNEWLKIPARESISTRFTAQAFEHDFKPDQQ
jgi:hypothetical protein